MFKAGHYHLLNGLAVVCFIFATAGCTPEPSCDGAIESVVLYSRHDSIFGGEKIYADLKNKGGVGVRKTLRLPTSELAEFYNVTIIDDYQHRFTGRKRICFDKYGIRVATCGSSINDENIPELSLYD
ncbi:hypothetical protein [Hymenobacter sp. BRD67]|uniref:hypothetical protein n=1 Tax=Hymenobacter sp. BRD67 TaxID=2675877 RepID=UPI001562FE11|nr:hypothetical protein [Hymenobacter sp. BRD67]QKG52764.1 hypothetical protein GKZ67_09335 [Hymenobacter sp. BRD67]